MTEQFPDYTGTNPEFKESELVEPANIQNLTFPLSFGSFYAAGMVILDTATGQPLVQEIDYFPRVLDAYGTGKAGQPVYCIIELKQMPLADLVVDYQYLGGRHATNHETLIRLTENIAGRTLKNVHYSQLLNKPTTTDVTELHGHVAADVTGKDEEVAAYMEIGRQMALMASNTNIPSEVVAMQQALIAKLREDVDAINEPEYTLSRDFTFNIGTRVLTIALPSMTALEAHTTGFQLNFSHADEPEYFSIHGHYKVAVDGTITSPVVRFNSKQFDHINDISFFQKGTEFLMQITFDEDATRVGKFNFLEFIPSADLVKFDYSTIAVLADNYDTASYTAYPAELQYGTGGTAMILLTGDLTIRPDEYPQGTLWSVLGSADTVNVTGSWFGVGGTTVKAVTHQDTVIMFNEELYLKTISDKQYSADVSLNTDTKTIVGAINELDTRSDNLDASITALAVNKQDKTDSGLATTSKTIVGAINELNLFVGTARNPWVLGSEDLDDVLAPGVYRCSSDSISTVVKNYPVALSGVLTVNAMQGPGGEYRQQHYQDRTGDTFFRMRVAADTWGGWEAHYTTARKPTKGDVGLSNVPNYFLTNDENDSSTTKFAGIKAVYDVNVKANDNTSAISNLGTIKQDKTDNALGTASKTVVGAINELKTAIASVSSIATSGMDFVSILNANQTLNPTSQSSYWLISGTRTITANWDDVVGTTKTAKVCQTGDNVICDSDTQEFFHEDLGTRIAGMDERTSTLEADVVRQTDVSESGQGGKVAIRDSQGDLISRTVRTELADDSGVVTGGLVFRRNNTTDNYHRASTSNSAVRTWLDVYSVSEIDTTFLSKVPASRVINTTAPLQGGGNLGATRTLSILEASTTRHGSVQLTSSVTNTSTTLAANALAVKTAKDAADNALSVANGKLASVPNASTTVVGGLKVRLDGNDLYITNDGSAP